MDGIFFRGDLELFEEAVIQRPKTGPTAFTQHRGTVAALTIVADARVGGLRLRVIQGNEERESLDLSLYIQGANAARARGVQDFSEDMPIYGCVDEPKSRLALRYHLAHGLIRITRLRFKQADQCSLLAQIMKDRGMPLRPMTAPQERPMTAPDNVHSRHGTSSSVTLAGNAVLQYGALNNTPMLNDQQCSQASSDYASSQQDSRSSTGGGGPQSRPNFMPGEFPLSSELSLPRLPSAPKSTWTKTTAPQRPSTSTFSSLALPDLPKPTPVTDRSQASRPSTADHRQQTNHYGRGLLPGISNLLDTGKRDVTMDDYTLPPSGQYRREESGLFSANPAKHAPGQTPRSLNVQDGRDKSSDDRRDSVLDGDDSDGLRAYVQRPEDERRAALDEHLLKKLDDPYFVKLCEDLETCWRARLYGQK